MTDAPAERTFVYRAIIPHASEPRIVLLRDAPDRFDLIGMRAHYGPGSVTVIVLEAEPPPRTVAVTVMT